MAKRRAVLVVPLAGGGLEHAQGGGALGQLPAEAVVPGIASRYRLPAGELIASCWDGKSGPQYKQPYHRHASSSGIHGFHSQTLIEASSVDRCSGLNSSQTSMLGSAAPGEPAVTEGWVN